MGNVIYFRRPIASQSGNRKTCRPRIPATGKTAPPLSRGKCRSASTKTIYIAMGLLAEAIFRDRPRRETARIRRGGSPSRTRPERLRLVIGYKSGNQQILHNHAGLTLLSCLPRIATNSKPSRKRSAALPDIPICRGLLSAFLRSPLK
jgi:hypothetical protein